MQNQCAAARHLGFELSVWPVDEVQNVPVCITGGGSENALRGDREEPRPVRHGGSDGGRTYQPADRSGSVPRQELQELHIFGAKPAANLRTNDKQAASPGMAELRVRVVAFAPGSRIDCAAPSAGGGPAPSA
ncbi:hypothetical protein AK812_SmicGene46669 [Symbiodinium microadriaticum]|uniref:Uncharacterized protein n=1 Tax=Symbiodinium microadriaticum TaxID=2951 RepID=A0A1Q9BTC8_SYMMI|nr:hypothetical protein AK812_SmicGene46669 [Symbiodinium microadriaticum]